MKHFIKNAGCFHLTQPGQLKGKYDGPSINWHNKSKDTLRLLNIPKVSFHLNRTADLPADQLQTPVTCFSRKNDVKNNEKQPYEPCLKAFLFCGTCFVCIEKSSPFLKVKFQLIANKRIWLVHISKWHRTTDLRGKCRFQD